MMGIVCMNFYWKGANEARGKRPRDPKRCAKHTIYGDRTGTRKWRWRLAKILLLILRARNPRDGVHQRRPWRANNNYESCDRNTVASQEWSVGKVFTDPTVLHGHATIRPQATCGFIPTNYESLHIYEMVRHIRLQECHRVFGDYEMMTTSDYRSGINIFICFVQYWDDRSDVTNDDCRLYRQSWKPVSRKESRSSIIRMTTANRSSIILTTTESQVELSNPPWAEGKTQQSTVEAFEPRRNNKNTSHDEKRATTRGETRKFGGKTYRRRSDYVLEFLFIILFDGRSRATTSDDEWAEDGVADMGGGTSRRKAYRRRSDYALVFGCQRRANDEFAGVTTHNNIRRVGNVSQTRRLRIGDFILFCLRGESGRRAPAVCAGVENEEFPRRRRILFSRQRRRCLTTTSIDRPIWWRAEGGRSRWRHTTAMDCNGSIDLFDYLFWWPTEEDRGEIFCWSERSRQRRRYDDAQGCGGDRSWGTEPSMGTMESDLYLGTSVFLIFHSRRASMTDLFFRFALSGIAIRCGQQECVGQNANLRVQSLFRLNSGQFSPWLGVFYLFETIQFGRRSRQWSLIVLFESSIAPWFLVK